MRSNTLLRRSSFLAACIAVVLAAAACSTAGPSKLPGASAAPVKATDLYGPIPDNPVRGGSLTIGSLTEPPSLDPFHQAADARIQVTVLMYQGLMYESASGIPQPLLAKSVKVSPDKKTYTFELRQNVKFHNGATMTSADVKYSYDYVRNPANGSPGAGDFQTIQSITAPNDSTVIITLSRPNAAMLMTLGNKYGGVVPKGYFTGTQVDTRLNSKDVGTGPFTLVSLKPNSSLQLERFKDYWDPGVPYLDTITFLFIPNSAAMAVGLQSGRLDLAVMPRPQDVAQLQNSKDLNIETFSSLNKKSLDLDSNNPILKNLKVRQAIALGLDKKQIAEAAYPGYAQVLGTMPAGMQDTWGLPLDQVPFSKRDPSKAKQLLQEAGYGNGLTLTLTIIKGYDWMDPAAVTLAAQLQPIGINIKIEKVDLAVWINNFTNHNMGFTLNDDSSQPDPSLLFYRHFHKRPAGSDFRNWNNDKGSALLDQGMAESDPAKRQATYHEFQTVLAETVPTIMIFSPKYIVASNKRVHNYVQHSTGWYFGLVQTYLTK